MFGKKSHEEESKLKRTAIVYDYDGTLAHGNIQENSFLPAIGMTRDDFWSEVKSITKQEDADEILVYMQFMLQKAKEANVQVTRENLKIHGNTSKLYAGLGDNSWFKRVNVFAAEHGLELEHYVLSSGTKEMIEGSIIANQFHNIFASKYIYDSEGNAEWPSLAINYTTKTQFLFRINKGVENTWDNHAVNSYMPDAKRPIPFSRMIFIGDGDTDIPAMKMTTYNGGHSIAVYNPEKNEYSLNKIHKLISDGRVDFTAIADYTENSQMDIIIKGIIGRIAHNEGYHPQ